MWKRRTRTIFTMSGVIIGCLAVFIISSITNGFEKYINDSMQGMMDTSVITVWPNWGGMDSDGKEEESQLKTELNDKSLEEIESLYFVTEVIPRKTVGCSIKFNKLENWGQVLAKDNFGDVKEPVLGGRFPRPDSKELLVGYDMAKQLLGIGWEETVEDQVIIDGLVGKQMKIGSGWGGYDEDGNEISPKMFTVRIVGVLSQSYNELSYMLTGSTKLVNDMIKSQTGMSKEEIDKQLKSYEQFSVRVDDKSNLGEYEETIKSLGYQTSSFKDFEDSSRSMLMGVSLVLGTLAGISLLVAALGITNTMDMAIYERNKEIGVIKVIGGSLNDVRKIFVGEACAIAFTGGIISIVLGLLVDLGINSVARSLTESMLGQGIEKIAIPTPSLIAGILVFCLLIGFVSGILPANKAAKTDVITAIR